MNTAGYILMLILNHCQDTGAQCELKQISPKIYSIEADCEWEKRRQSLYYGEDNLVCARVERKSEWNSW